jgi:glutamine synthetase
VVEAKKRGIPNIKSTVEALGYMATPEAVKLFEKYKVLSKVELHSRHEIYVEQYVKHINIEAQASVDMVKRQYIPTVIRYTSELAETIGKLKAVSASSSVQKELLTKISALLESANKKLGILQTALDKAHAVKDLEARAAAFRDKVVAAMNDLRSDIDAIEPLFPAGLWPVPTYAEMLFKL